MGIANVISAIEAEIALLQQARALLAGAPTGAAKKRGRPAGVAKPAKKRRNLSPEGRARIAAAVKARWAKQKAAKK